MRTLKFREFLPTGRPSKFHYWGFINEGAFYGPSDPKGIHQQFTGCKDMNGKDIYEGDALKSYEVRLASEDKVMFVKSAGCTFVIYNPDCCNICRDGDGCIGPLDEWPDNTFEVIGNIYENPELLKS